jgi:hypothetical protein
MCRLHRERSQSINPEQRLHREYQSCSHQKNKDSSTGKEEQSPSSLAGDITLCTSLRTELRSDFRKGSMLVKQVGYESLVYGSLVPKPILGIWSQKINLKGCFV